MLLQTQGQRFDAFSRHRFQNNRDFYHLLVVEIQPASSAFLTVLMQVFHTIISRKNSVTWRLKLHHWWRPI